MAAIWAKLELYLIIAGVAGALVVAAYFKGSYDKEREINTKELAAAAAALSQYAEDARSRAIADAGGRKAAEEFIRRVNAQLADIDARFANVPQVIINDKGCADIGPGFRMRWNAEAATVTAGGSGADKPHE